MNDSIKLLAEPWTHFLVFLMWADHGLLKLQFINYNCNLSRPWADKIIWHAALLHGIRFLSDPTLVPFLPFYSPNNWEGHLFNLEYNKNNYFRIFSKSIGIGLCIGYWHQS